MNHRNNNQDFRQRVDLYFDKELSKDDEQALLRQVDVDPRCQKVFRKEQNFRDFIRNNVKRPTVSPDLIQSIKDKIRT